VDAADAADAVVAANRYIQARGDEPACHARSGAHVKPDCKLELHPGLDVLLGQNGTGKATL
jgi:hypothetical protein